MNKINNRMIAGLILSFSLGVIANPLSVVLQGDASGWDSFSPTSSISESSAADEWQ